jgi:protoporphyrinogen/coproporphyrinogen III oxidase
MVRSVRVVIVGGGITGLSAAAAAAARAREIDRSASITLLEASGRLGGNIVTERVDGYVLDAGPDSWVASKPHATALAKNLGLGGALVGTREHVRRYYVVWNGRLHAVPEGIVLGVPTRLGPLAGTRLFTWGGKLRMALEPFVQARRYQGDEDESIADFASRRLGREAADRLVAPLLGGISAGDANALSVRAAFPQLVAMENDYGSLTRGMLAARRKRATADPEASKASAFLSLEGGMGALVDALYERVRSSGVVVRRSTPARSIERSQGVYRVGVGEGETLTADAVLLAAPAHSVASLLGSLDADAGGRVSTLAYGSTATVFLAYKRSDVRHPLDGVGFVVPRSLGRPILASTWVSSKWAHRAPEGQVLLRAFFGGAGGQDVVTQDDATLTALARRELGALMGLEAEPLWSRVFRFERASAQMRVGHLAVMRGLRERMKEAVPGVLIAGGGYGVTGIPDCIREGQEAGRAMVEPRVAAGIMSNPQGLPGSNP